MSLPRFCKYCLEPIVQKPGERDECFRVREYCDRKHASAHFQEKRKEGRK